MPAMSLVLKWVVAGVVSAFVSTLKFFQNFGTPLVRGLVMIGIGFAILYFFKDKLGYFSAIPAGLMVAGGAILAKEYMPAMGV